MNKTTREQSGNTMSNLVVTPPAKPPLGATERSSATIKKLLVACVQVLIDKGYYRASTQEICNQAGLSQGALFRHFPTRLDLMVATGEYIGEQLLEQFILRFRRDEPDLSPDLINMTLQLLRANSRAPLQLAWFELVVAARTDHALREALRPIWQRKMTRIREHALKLLPELKDSIPEFVTVTDIIMLFFHGEAINNMVQPPETGDAERELWLSRFFHTQLTLAQYQHLFPATTQQVLTSDSDITVSE